MTWIHFHHKKFPNHTSNLGSSCALARTTSWIHLWKCYNCACIIILIHSSNWLPNICQLARVKAFLPLCALTTQKTSSEQPGPINAGLPQLPQQSQTPLHYLHLQAILTHPLPPSSFPTPYTWEAAHLLFLCAIIPWLHHIHAILPQLPHICTILPRSLCLHAIIPWLPWVHAIIPWMLCVHTILFQSLRVCVILFQLLRVSAKLPWSPRVHAILLQLPCIHAIFCPSPQVHPIIPKTLLQ